MTSRKKQSAASGNGTIDIPHKEVKLPPNDQPAMTPVVETVDDQISHELQKFNFPESAIRTLKDEFGGLTITGPEDKAGYKSVRDAWSLVRSKRTGLEKKGLELRGNFKVITTAIGKEEDRLIALLTPLEEDLYAKWKKIDDDKERAKKEQEEAEGRRLMDRIEQLQEVGMKFRDGFYQIGETITADVATLRAMPDDMFEKLKAAAKNKAAELQKIAEEEAEKKRKEEAEQERQRQELKKQQEELADQQRQFQQQKDEMARQLRDLRLGKLQAIGLSLLPGTPEVVAYESVRLYLSPLIEMTAEEFNSTVTKTADHITELKNKAAEHAENIRQQQIERERKEKHIADALEMAGLKFVYSDRVFRYKDDAVTIEKTFDELNKMSDLEISMLAKDLVEKISVAKIEQNNRDLKAVADRQKAETLALSDKQRWAREMEQMSAHALRIVPSEYKTKSYQSASQKFLDKLNNLISEFKD